MKLRKCYLFPLPRFSKVRLPNYILFPLFAGERYFSDDFHLRNYFIKFKRYYIIIRGGW